MEEIALREIEYEMYSIQDEKKQAEYLYNLIEGMSLKDLLRLHIPVYALQALKHTPKLLARYSSKGKGMTEMEVHRMYGSTLRESTKGVFSAQRLVDRLYKSHSKQYVKGMITWMAMPVFKSQGQGFFVGTPEDLKMVVDPKNDTPKAKGYLTIRYASFTTLNVVTENGGLFLNMTGRVTPYHSISGLLDDVDLKTKVRLNSGGFDLWRVELLLKANSL